MVVTVGGKEIPSEPSEFRKRKEENSVLVDGWFVGSNPDVYEDWYVNYEIFEEAKELEKRRATILSVEQHEHYQKQSDQMHALKVLLKSDTPDYAVLKLQNEVMNLKNERAKLMGEIEMHK